MIQKERSVLLEVIISIIVGEKSFHKEICLLLNNRRDGAI